MESKLTSKQKGESYKSLSDKYNVTITQIHNIVKYISWKHVMPQPTD